MNRRIKYKYFCVNRTTDELIKEYLPLGQYLFYYLLIFQ